MGGKRELWHIPGLISYRVCCIRIRMRVIWVSLFNAYKYAHIPMCIYVSIFLVHANSTAMKRWTPKKFYALLSSFPLSLLLAYCTFFNYYAPGICATPTHLTLLFLFYTICTHSSQFMLCD